MHRAIRAFAATLLLAVTSTPAFAATPARVETHHFTPSAFAPGTVRVDVHLPPGYDPDASPGYPVLYLHDGQDARAVRLRETLADLYDRDAIAPVIVAAIHMLPDRMGTYGLSDREAGTAIVANIRYGPVGTRAHDYAQWVATGLVPAVDARYNTRTTPDARATLGWSLGALAAFNLGWQYPDLFARVGMFSPSLWLSSDTTDAGTVQCTRLADHLPDPATHRLWFDHGTATLDARYAPYQQRMDARLREAGYVEGGNWVTRVYEGAEHNEAAWRARIDEVLVFLLGD